MRTGELCTTDVEKESLAKEGCFLYPLYRTVPPTPIKRVANGPSNNVPAAVVFNLDW